MPTRNVNLTDHFDRFIEAGIASGREGLHLLEQREREDQAKIEWLRAAATEGFDAIERGDYTSLNSEEELDDFLEQIHQDASAKLTAGPDRC